MARFAVILLLVALVAVCSADNTSLRRGHVVEEEPTERRQLWGFYDILMLRKYCSYCIVYPRLFPVVVVDYIIALLTTYIYYTCVLQYSPS